MAAGYDIGASSSASDSLGFGGNISFGPTASQTNTPLIVAGVVAVAVVIALAAFFMKGRR